MNIIPRINKTKRNAAVVASFALSQIQKSKRPRMQPTHLEEDEPMDIENEEDSSSTGNDFDNLPPPEESNPLSPSLETENSRSLPSQEAENSLPLPSQESGSGSGISLSPRESESDDGEVVCETGVHNENEEEPGKLSRLGIIYLIWFNQFSCLLIRLYLSFRLVSTETKRKQRSWIWKFFEKNDENKTISCNICRY